MSQQRHTEVVRYIGEDNAGGHVGEKEEVHELFGAVAVLFNPGLRGRSGAEKNKYKGLR